MTAAEDLVTELLAETRDEINRADAKANILLTGAGLAVAALAAGLVSGQINPIDARGAVQALAAASALSLLAGLAAVGAAVFPHLGTPVAGRARYFMEVAQFDDVAELQHAVSREPTGLVARRLQQLLVLSRAVRRKYRLVRASEVLLGAGIGMAVFAGFLHTAMN